MQIIIDTDPTAPTRWRWIILDQAKKPLAGSPDGKTMTAFEALEAARAFVLAQANYYQALYAFPQHGGEKSADAMKKALDPMSALD